MGFYEATFVAATTNAANGRKRKINISFDPIFLSPKVIKIKFFATHPVKGETSEVTVGDIQRSIQKHKPLYAVGFCGHHTNAYFIEALLRRETKGIINGKTE
jgi:hypothetical protein